MQPNARLAPVVAIGRLTNWQWTGKPKLGREALGLQFRRDGFYLEKKSVDRFQGDDNLGITSKRWRKERREEGRRGEERRGQERTGEERDQEKWASN